MRLTVLLILTLSIPSAFAAEPAKPRTPAPPTKVAPPPPLPTRDSPSVAEPETGLEPEVTITTRGDVTHEEYRLHGKLYMIKVIPKRGPPYYLIDHEGRGEFRRSDIETRISPPNWVIKSW